MCVHCRGKNRLPPAAVLLPLRAAGLRQISQACFGVAFAAMVLPLFVAFVTLSRMGRLDMFPRAASVNRASMLAASFSSGIVGFIIALATAAETPAPASSTPTPTFMPTTSGPYDTMTTAGRDAGNVSGGGSDPQVWTATFVASLASSFVSLAVVLAAALPCRWAWFDGRWRTQLQLRLCHRRNRYGRAETLHNFSNFPVLPEVRQQQRQPQRPQMQKKTLRQQNQNQTQKQKQKPFPQHPLSAEAAQKERVLERLAQPLLMTAHTSFTMRRALAPVTTDETETEGEWEWEACVELGRSWPPPVPAARQNEQEGDEKGDAEVGCCSRNVEDGVAVIRDPAPAARLSREAAIGDGHLGCGNHHNVAHAAAADIACASARPAMPAETGRTVVVVGVAAASDLDGSADAPSSCPPPPSPTTSCAVWKLLLCGCRSTHADSVRVARVCMFWSTAERQGCSAAIVDDGWMMLSRQCGTAGASACVPARPRTSRVRVSAVDVPDGLLPFLPLCVLAHVRWLNIPLR